MAVSALRTDMLVDALYLAVGGARFEWDAHPTGRLVKVWRRPFFIPRPAVFMAAKVRAADYTSLTLRIFSDVGVTPVFDRAITMDREFTLPSICIQRVVTLELRGTSRVQSCEIAESMEELT